MCEDDFSICFSVQRLLPITHGTLTCPNICLTILKLYKKGIKMYFPGLGYAQMLGRVNRLALKSGIDGHLESPQVGHSRPANTAQRLDSFYVVASSD